MRAWSTGKTCWPQLCFLARAGVSGLIAALLLSGCTEQGQTTGQATAGQSTPAAQAPASGGGPVAMRRLTETQYRQSIADIFGEDVEIFGRFEPDNRRDRLLAVGTAWASITPSGFEQYDSMARGIASQVVAPERRERVMPCEPASASSPDPDCAAQFIAEQGRQLWRRPLLDDDIQPRVAVASQAAEQLGDFYAGLEFALASLLSAPEFLFRVEVAEPDPGQPGELRLNAYSRASRLSFLLWNTTPDEELLAAAERGELDDRDGLVRQVERLMASERLHDGVRAFFMDMLEFDRFDQVAKDAMIYPAFSSRVAADAREQTLRALVDHLVEREGDYRDVFTTRRFPMTRPLGLVYGVPVVSRDGWEIYTFPEDGSRAGLLTHVSLMALHSHPGRSSPTLRGKFIREAFMCQQVPPPPADVDFTMDEEFEVLKTARARLQRHASDPACAGCHQLMDPIGLTLERFDGIGSFRTHEEGEAIDVNGSLDGLEFADAPGLGQAMRKNPAVPACLVDTLYRYGLGRGVAPAEREFVNYLEEQFARSGYRLVDLMRAIATSDAFFAISAPRGSGPESTEV